MVRRSLMAAAVEDAMDADSISEQHALKGLVAPAYNFTMRRFWLLFSQATTILVAAFFVVNTLKPEWLSQPRIDATAIGAPSSAATVANLPIGSFRQAASRASSAVVSISTSRAGRKPEAPVDPWSRFFFGERGPEPQAGLGSGVIVSAQGHVLTNNHVVDGADGIEVVLNDGRTAQARVLGTDPETDLALLQIRLDKLPVIDIGDSDAAQVGDQVLAIGNPFGVGQTVTSGIVSAIGRNQLGINTFENFIQTDAAINPGNSGGALVDTAGRLLGINTAIYSRSGGSLGIGFAIPVSTARNVMDALIKDGQVTRGWIGVEPNEMSAELADTFGIKARKGVIITGVLQNGPAAQSGVRPGDVITAVGAQSVSNVPELLSSVAALKPGTEASFAVQRQDQSLDLKITPGVRPKPRKPRQ